MATLLSPGVSVNVIDESQFVSAGPGTIPLFILPTHANKTTPSGDAIAQATIPANTNTLELLTSQRDLTQKYGVPFFEKNNVGDVIQGSEINEYGLLSAYQYLGIANRAYVLRADVNLNELEFQQSEPRGEPVNGTFWFDIQSTQFGVFRSNGSTTPGLAWDVQEVLLPTDSEIDGSFVPLNTFGNNGDIAVVYQTTSNGHYEKISGAWYLIGSDAWKQARPTVALGTVTNPTVTNGGTIILNGNTVTISGTTLTDVVNSINGASIPDITAADVGNALEIALATGEDLSISGSERTALGLDTLYEGHELFFQTHVNIPSGENPGDIWVKTTDPNQGADYAVKRYNASIAQFETIEAPLYEDDVAADAALGSAKNIGSLYVQYNVSGTAADPEATLTIKRWDGSNWSVLNYQASFDAPTTDPDAGTLWVSDEFKVDIMVSDGDEWKGYLNEFPGTDPNGVQITSKRPTFQTDGTPLVDNDLWLDSADLDNYPALYRWSTSSNKWELIDKTDQTTPFGIVFADARPNADGTENGSENITDLLVSDYVDADAPNPQTYPAGMLLFNMRYSTYNVKEWRSEYFDGQDAYTVGVASFPAPTYEARWVTVSGLEQNGSPNMGRFAQRAVVVESLAASIVANEDIRSEFIFFNLLGTPGYPELIDELVSLNVDRKETGFIITDTPLRLKPDGTSLNAWANNLSNEPGTNEDGRITRYTYSAQYYPQALSTNLDGEEVVMPASAVAFRTYAFNDNVAYPWFPPAGTTRGVIQNASSVGFITDEQEYRPVILNQGQRDVLYQNDINPLANLPGRGLVVYGDKTLHPEDSALDRINVARLVVFLRRQLDQLAQPFLFELNTESTRSAAQSVFERFLGDLVALEALNDFAVEVSSANNTPERIDRNELWIDIAIEPTKSINFIFIPLRIQRQGSIS